MLILYIVNKYLWLFFLIYISGNPVKENNVTRKFPDDFLFGVATASYQIEGAWNDSGKGLNVWDQFTHNHPELISDRSNGDIAADSYHKFDEDIKLVKGMGVIIFPNSC